jgi:poly-gamma-glutamate synthase PgsB/CapB
VTVIFSAALLAALLALGVAERRARDRAHAAIPIRIHVNGTRGKSTVTRMIAGALREAGIRCVAKTTGTEPRLILPDGSERAVRRRAPASIREQLWILRESRKLNAAALVVECMAVEPGLQAVSERDMIRSTVGVITNARLDHAEVMGSTVDDVAAALSATIPAKGTIVIGPTGGADVLVRAARTRGTRVVRAGANDRAGSGAPARPWSEDNLDVALAVTRTLGIPEETARRGMLAAAPDPGAISTGSTDLGMRRVDYVDAAAANDPESLGRLLEPRARDAVFVFHHRLDRPMRLRQFGDAPPWTRPADRVVVTGDRPDWTTWRRLRRQLPGSRLTFERPARLADSLRRSLGAQANPDLVVFCGNTKGFHRQSVLAGLQRS